MARKDPLDKLFLRHDVAVAHVFDTVSALEQVAAEADAIADQAEAAAADAQARAAVARSHAGIAADRAARFRALLG